MKKLTQPKPTRQSVDKPYSRIELMSLRRFARAWGDDGRTIDVIVDGTQEEAELAVCVAFYTANKAHAARSAAQIKPFKRCA